MVVGEVFVWIRFLNMFLFKCVLYFGMKEGFGSKWKLEGFNVNLGRINNFLKFWIGVFWEFNFLSLMKSGFINMVM